MIAKNFVKYPEALRFQCEMFSNGYHNSPRIMRLMECVFDWSATVPDWWKEAKGRARDLAKQVRKSIGDFFKDSSHSENFTNLPPAFHVEQRKPCMGAPGTGRISLVLPQKQDAHDMDRLQRERLKVSAPVELAGLGESAF